MRFEGFRQTRNVRKLTRELESLFESTEGIEDFAVKDYMAGLLRFLGDQALYRSAEEGEIEYQAKKKSKEEEIENLDRNTSDVLIWVSVESFEYDVLRNLLPLMDGIARGANAEVPLHTNDINHSEVYSPPRWILRTIYEVR